MVFVDPPAGEIVDIGLVGEGLPRTRWIRQVLLSGVVLELEGRVLAEGQLVGLCVQREGAAEPLRTTGRVVLLEPGEEAGVYVAGLEFVGTYYSLHQVRGELATSLGSRILAYGSLAGYVLSERPGTTTCYDASTGLLAVLGPNEDGSGYLIRHRVGVETFEDGIEALMWAYGMEERPAFEPPFELPEPSVAAEQLEDDNEDELFGAQTIVLGKDAPLSEAEILGAQTLVLPPTAAPSASDEAAILGAQTLLVGDQTPAGGTRGAPQPSSSSTGRWGRRSKVYSGPLLVGLVVPTGEQEWSVQDDDEDELARVVLEDRGLTIVPPGGDPCPARDWNEALRVILDLDEDPTTVSPPLAV